MKKLLLFVIISLFSMFLNAQNKDFMQGELANEYFYNSQYDKCIDIYEDLLKQSFNPQYYENLLNAYYNTENNKGAEKVIKRMIKQFPQNSIFIAELGTHYLRLGDKTKAEKQFDKAIQMLKANHQEIIILAEYFSKKKNLDYAANTYLKGRELLNDPYRYVYELTFIYQAKADYAQMVMEYINVLDKNPQQLDQIKIYLGNQIQQDNDGKFIEHLKNAILRKVQQQPNNQIIAQLYIWILLKQEDYAMAFSQAKSMDKRFEQESAETVFEIASISLNNNIFDIATNAFKYIIAKGEGKPYYLKSRLGLLSSMYFPFINKVNHTEKEIILIRQEYEKALSELGKRAATVEIMQQYAFILAYYLNSSQDAVDLLDETLNMSQISRQVKAYSKLMRADIYLMENDIWEASLTYSQVEKEFKNDIIGSEAKFKNAKLSFFNGDFEWAASQFDVLRASTTKLIANDAMQYSLLISDNIDEDSSYNGLAYYAKAEFALYQNKYDKAEKFLDTINILYLSHPLFDEILYKRAEIEMKKKDYKKADSLLQRLVFLYPNDILVDDALYLLAEINQMYLSNREKTIEYYERIILDYPNSLYVTESRKRLNALKQKS